MTERGDEIMGTGAARLSVGASRFELIRATTGRRSEREIAAYVWEPASTDVTVLVGAPMFTIRTEPLGE